LVEEYADDSGQETNTSYDHKKILKIFFRWIKLGSREFQEVGDPDETRWIKPKRVKDNLSREDSKNPNRDYRCIPRMKFFVNCYLLRFLFS
jgi:hypothetical protein